MAEWFETIGEQQKKIREQPILTRRLGLYQATRDEEVERVLRDGLEMDSKDSIRAEWVMSNQTVHHWLKSRRSRRLLINGNSTIERISPISFFCAVLIKSLKAIEPIHVLGYFCGLNWGFDTFRRQGVPGGEDLLQSLANQLISQWKFGPLTCLSEQELADLVRIGRKHSIGYLRSMFRKLIITLPAGTLLFIIIDGITYYETTHLPKITKMVVEEITGLIEEEEVKALVKVIVTSPNRALAPDVRKCFSDNEKVWVPETLS